MKKIILLFLSIIAGAVFLYANNVPAIHYVTSQQCSDRSFGKDFIQLSSPQNVIIEISGNDVVLSWSPVTTDINGNPINANYCYYNIYFGDTPDIEIDVGNNLAGFTTATEFIHEAAANESKLFYVITASRGSIVTDFDGNQYHTIIIGDQEWMMENLKVTHYRNGDPIPHITDSNGWVGTSNGAYCVYGNQPYHADTYGHLYNWFAVNDSRGLAPEGWHVPTDDDIKELEIYLGMSQNQTNSTGWRGSNEGSKLAGSADLWINGLLENDPEFNISGFRLRPGGCRNDNGDFYCLTANGFFWSSSESSSSAWSRYLYYPYTTVNRSTMNKHYGFSVRCVRLVIQQD